MIPKQQISAPAHPIATPTDAAQARPSADAQGVGEIAPRLVASVEQLPGPLVLESTGGLGFLIYAPDKRFTRHRIELMRFHETVDSVTNATFRAWAERIVQCVNAHDELVAIVRDPDLYELLMNLQNGIRTRIDKAEANRCIVRIDRALAALSPASPARQQLSDEDMPPEVEGRLSVWLTLGKELHPLTVNLVVRFARALSAKLADAEQKYGYSDGWRSPEWMDECRAKLMQHIAKGDPRDVAAYCAFLWHHGESTAVGQVEQQPAPVAGPLPPPWGFAYVWDTPEGQHRSFHAAHWNGRPCTDQVVLFTAEQMRLYAAPSPQQQEPVKLSSLRGLLRADQVAQPEPGLMPTDSDLHGLFVLDTGGPNPYHKCTRCNVTVPGIRSELAAHWLTHHAPASIPAIPKGSDMSDEPVRRIDTQPALGKVAECLCVYDMTDGFCHPKNNNACKCWSRAEEIQQSTGFSAQACVWILRHRTRIETEAAGRAA
jgi:hypothetical protein